MIHLLLLFVLIPKQLDASDLIDLRQLNGRVLYDLSSIGASTQTWPRLYSGQLNDLRLAVHFRINRTRVELSSDVTRHALCASVNSCYHDNQNQCLLDLNLIVYLKNETKSSFNDIKLVKLAIVLADWSHDSIIFEQLEYNFVFDKNSKSENDVQEIGLVTATTLLNQDLTDMIKYYVEFGSKDKLDLIDLISINEHTGMLSVNRTKLINHKYGRYYVFFVNAVMKCSQNHRALLNRTIVKLKFVDEKKDRPVVNLISLVDRKRLVLSNHIDCLKINQYDLTNSPQIALAQLQIDNFNLNQSFKFVISQSNKFKVKIEHLIDNLFAVYLIKSNSSFLFLSEVLKINLELRGQSEPFIYSEFYVCVNVRTRQPLDEQLSMVKFKDNLVVVDYEHNSAVLEVNGANNYNFILDPTFDQLNFRLEKLSPNSVKIVLDTHDLLAYHEALVLAFDSNIPVQQFLKSYSFLKQIGLEHRKFVSFAAKVVFKREPWHNHGSSQFSTMHKISGYLPPIESLVPYADLVNFGNSIDNYFYHSNDSQCFKVNKYTGLISSISFNCTLNSSLSVSLKNVDNRYNLDNIFKFKLIDKNISKPVFISINGSLAKNEFNLNFDLNLNRLNVINDKQIEIVRLLSDKQDTFYYYRSNRQQLLNLDSKLGSISLNLSDLYASSSFQLINQCLMLEVLSKSYEYMSPARRVIKSNDLIDINVCFSFNTHQDVFVAGRLTSGFSFQFLRVQSLSHSMAFIAFIGLFATASILLMAIIVYMYRSSNGREIMTKQYWASSECKLKIRNDDLYDSVERGLVPSKLDVLLNKKPISPDCSEFIEVVSDKEVSEDQGVYCVATGTSFESNLSNASECIDSASNFSLMDASGQQIVIGLEKKLCLFDLTPMPKQTVCEPLDADFVDGVNAWLKSNKDNRLVVSSSQVNFSFDTQTSTISSNECII